MYRATREQVRRRRQAILVRLNEAIRTSFAAPGMRDKMGAIALSPVGSSIEAFSAFLKNETAKYARAVKAAQIEPQ